MNYVAKNKTGMVSKERYLWTRYLSQTCTYQPNGLTRLSYSGNFSTVRRAPRSAVYILGDLFENFWVGDDERTPPAVEIINVLRDCCRHNKHVYLVRGNRDLMLDQGFCALTGCNLLDDETIIKLSAIRRHCSCTATCFAPGIRNTSYIEGSWKLRLIRRLYLSLPYRLRILLSRGMQPLIKKSAAGKPPEIIDVEQASVEAAMTRHKTTELIHGHTHKPGFHHFNLNGQAARRIVLGDWYEQDSVLVCRGTERKLLRVHEYIKPAD